MPDSEVNLKTRLPRITIVTPSFNQGAYLERTICSVLDQGYPNLEYMVVDGGSTDQSLSIIERYADRLSYWVSEPDDGMYHAVQKGFERSTGEIMAWINSDDMYHRGAFRTVAQIFTDFPRVRWVTGVPTIFDEYDRIVGTLPLPQWSKWKFYLGEYQWIQQESTFWHRTLWEQIGGSIDTSVSLAADFALWLSFFRYERLYSVQSALGGFRIRSRAQKTLEGSDVYAYEAKRLMAREFTTLAHAEKKKVQRLRAFEKVLTHVPGLMRLRWAKKSWVNGRQYSPPLLFDRTHQKFRLATPE